MSRLLREIAAPFIAAAPAGARVRTRLRVSPQDAEVLTAVGRFLGTLAGRDLAAEQRTLKTRVRKIEARIAVPSGGRDGRTAGYATPAERHGKTLRLKALKGRLARVERRIEAEAVSVTRGGRRLMRARLSLADARMTDGSR